MSTHLNTKPSTVFGHFFYKCGIWHPSIEEGIIAAYDMLHDDEKIAIKSASGIFAVINTNLEAAPDFLWDILESKFPGLTKDTVTGFLNHINTQMKVIDGAIPDDFNTALTKLREYLNGFEGDGWIGMVRMAVEFGASFLSNGKLSIQAIIPVLEYVYRTFIKGKIA
jgi:hypothetical protein